MPFGFKFFVDAISLGVSYTQVLFHHCFFLTWYLTGICCGSVVSGSLRNNSSHQSDQYNCSNNTPQDDCNHGPVHVPLGTTFTFHHVQDRFLVVLKNICAFLWLLLKTTISQYCERLTHPNPTLAPFKLWWCG